SMLAATVFRLHSGCVLILLSLKDCIVAAAVFSFVILLCLRDCIVAAAMSHSGCSLKCSRVFKF
ncbi:hypothetical protein U1Q18_028164, partial [Sarracenia purpurea var. burkii]